MCTRMNGGVWKGCRRIEAERYRREKGANVASSATQRLVCSLTPNRRMDSKGMNVAHSTFHRSKVVVVFS